MANNRFNKQVTPKGYKMGGRVSKMGGGMMKRPMYKDGSLKPVDDKKRKSKKIEANKAEYKKMAKKISPDVAMYLKHGKDFPGFDKARRIRGGLKKGGEAKTMYKPYNRKDFLESAKKARERNKKQDARKKEINEAAKKFKVGGGGKYKYGPHKVDVNRRATESLLGRGKIQEKIIKFADKFDKKLEDRRKNKKAMGGRIRRMGGGSLKAVQPNQKGLKKLPTEVRNKMGFMKKGGKVHGK